MELINAFWVGGLICVLGQLLIDLTKLTPARVMVIFVLSGIVLGAFGLYDPIVDFASCGATVPLCGFGNLLATGVREAVEAEGIIGALKGGLTSSSSGIASAVTFAFIAALIAKPHEKK